MGFRDVLDDIGGGFAFHPFAARTRDGEFRPGQISIDHLESKYGDHFPDADACKAAASYEGHKRFFDWLKEQGKLQ